MPSSRPTFGWICFSRAQANRPGASPEPAVGKVAGLVAFYNELVDMTVDGEPLARPVSVFSEADNRP